MPLYPTKVAKLKNTENKKCWRECRETGTHTLLV